MTCKKMGISMLCITLSVLLLLAMPTIVLDPLFHYHAPATFQNYSLYNQRYQNDGIGRNFDYDAIITGTSMTENFLVSECNELFDVNAVKCCFSGASYKEINDFLTLAIQRQPKTKLVIRSLDTSKLLDDKDAMAYDDYPTYLYDESLFNDLNYLLNKDILLEHTFHAAVHTLRKRPSTTFDEYSFWGDSYSYGKDVVMSSYDRPDKCENIPFSEQDAQTVRDTIYQNYITLAQNNPDVEFYVFMPPYSVVFWDSWNQTGDLQRNLEAQELAVQLLLEQENVHLFSFLDRYDLVSDLNRYKDVIHYDAQVNSEILQDMVAGRNQITTENVTAYLYSVYAYYTTYPYNNLFE